MIQVETWLQISKKLMPSGRIMVNCGGADVEESISSSWVQNPTVKALCSAFPGQVWCNSSAIFICTSITKIIYFQLLLPDLRVFSAKISKLWSNLCLLFCTDIIYSYFLSIHFFCTDYHLSSASNVMDTIYLWVVSY